jgi:hypothetical protein
MKKLLILTVAIAGSFALFGQRNCGSMGNLDRLSQAEPRLEQNMARIEKFTEKYVSGGFQQKGTIYTVPVVVHVIYKAGAENISDAQIQSQIAILNEDFRRLNADKVNTPSTFTSIAADAEIQFCLASVSPTGGATNGITRTSTTTTSFSSNDNMKYTSQGGKDAWDATKYMNLWVCNLSGGLLGYAQFPGGPAETDGVVIGYKYCGDIGTATSPFDKGRTATHEVGHWLNLRHIWGDATCGNDLVSDTPVHLTSNAGCPSHPKSNTCGASAEMHMNYMDYTDDACMNVFSEGQKTRMRALFTTGGARESLLTSNGCGSGTPTYCSASSTTTNYEWISNVTVGTINNSTTGSGGYADYTAQSATLNVNSNYPISLTPAFASSTYTEYFNVYIDYNGDKDFDDVGELVYSSSGTTTKVNGNFTIPGSATQGSTRMRVMMKDGAIAGPCGSFTYGEVEDYTINIGSASGCGTPSGLSASSITTTSATLNWGTVTGATSYNVRYKVLDGPTWTATIATTNNKAISGLSASSSYEFQVQAVCSGVNGTYTGSANFATSAAETVLTVGTGTGTTGATPYGTYYMDGRVQFLISKAELDAVGYNAANNVIKSMAFNVSTASSQTMNNFTIKMAHTSATSFSSTSFMTGTLTTVFSGNIVATPGWNTHSFSTNFNYDGSSSLAVEICFDNNIYTTDSYVYYTNTSAYSTLYLRTDLPSSGACGNTTGTRAYSRPNIRFVFGPNGSKTDGTVNVIGEGNEEAVALMDFDLYPNPATSNLTVSYTLTNKDDVQIAITTVTGVELSRTVLNKQAAGIHNERVDLSGQSFSDLPNGLYLCSVIINGKQQTKRFVIAE